jgi:hypothetical protein
MGSPTSPVPKSLSEREQPYFSVAIRLFGATTITLITVGLIWGAISVHDADSAGTFGWLMGPAVWLMSSAYSKWKKIPVSDRTDPQLNRGRVINRVALASLVLVIIGTTLTITVALQRRQARSRRVKEILQQTKLEIPAITQNRLNVKAIMGRNSRTFEEFRIQCADLEVALQESDAFAVKKEQLRDQLGREMDDPDALSLLKLFGEIREEDSKATLTLHRMVSCSDVLARSDALQQGKFMSLCVEPANSELLVSAANENKLLKEHNHVPPSFA